MAREVNVAEYVEELLEAGVPVVVAEKFARIRAEQGLPGEEVVTWSVDADGNPIVEKTAEVTVHPETGQPGWIVTKCDDEGNPVVDEHGHTNQWIIDEKTFNKKYESDQNLGRKVYKPKGGPQKFIEIQEDITIEQWGSKMTVAQGGQINITNPDDMYGISARDFGDTYRVVGLAPKK